MGEKRNVYESFVLNTERMRPLRRPGCRWKDDFKMS